MPAQFTGPYTQLLAMNTEDRHRNTLGPVPRKGISHKPVIFKSIHFIIDCACLGTQFNIPECLVTSKCSKTSPAGPVKNRFPHQNLQFFCRSSANGRTEKVRPALVKEFTRIIQDPFDESWSHNNTIVGHGRGQQSGM